MVKPGLIFSLAGAWIAMLILGIIRSDDILKWNCDGYKQQSILIRFMPISEVFGAYFCCFLSEIIGRKFTMLALYLPIIFSCILMQFFCNMYVIIVANYIRAIALGGAFAILPVYVGELSEKQNRGKLISFLFTAYVIGAQIYIAIFRITIVDIEKDANIALSIINFGSVILCIITSIVFCRFAVESPCYYINRRQFDPARESMIKTRSLNVDINYEMNQLIKKIGDEESNNKTVMSCLGSRGCLKACIIAMSMAVFQSLTSENGIIYFYASSLTNVVGSGSIQTISSLVIIGSTFICPFLVDRIGRIKCLLMSFLTIFLSLLLLVILNSLEHTNTVDILSALVRLIYNCGFNLGAGPVLLILQGELFPMKVKMLLSATTAAIASALQYLILFLVLFEVDSTIFVVLNMVCCLIAAIIKLFYFETNGKSFNDIQLTLYRQPNTAI